jgi:hypothetical protein
MDRVFHPAGTECSRGGGGLDISRLQVSRAVINTAVSVDLATKVQREAYNLAAPWDSPKKQIWLIRSQQRPRHK